MGLRIFAGLLALVCLVIVVFADTIANFLRDKNILGFGIEKYHNESNTKIRIFGMLGVIVFGAVVTQSTQLITGMIILVIGIISVKYSTYIYNLMAIGGMGNSAWFKGDSLIKFAGVLMVIAGSLWMSGITQMILRAIFESGGMVQ